MTGPVGGPVTPSPASSSPASSSTETRTTVLTAQQEQALDAALAAEHAAVYAYGVIGAQSGKSDRVRALDELQRHAQQRDLLAGRLSAAGFRPPAGSAAYALPAPVRSSAAARALAARVEDALAAVYADLVAATGATGRGEAAGWLTDSVLAAHRWGAPTQIFPGLPERTVTAPDTTAPDTAAPDTAGPDTAGQDRSTS